MCVSKVFAVSVELDVPVDVESAQSRYLDSIVAEHRSQEGRAFAVRFQYRLDGTSHWEGDLFVLEVEDGSCLLRYAGAGDTSEHVSQREARLMRWSRRPAGGPPAVPGPRRFAVELEAPWVGLRGEDLRAALELFRVADVMNS